MHKNSSIFLFILPHFDCKHIKIFHLLLTRSIAKNPSGTDQYKFRENEYNYRMARFHHLIRSHTIFAIYPSQRLLKNLRPILFILHQLHQLSTTTLKQFTTIFVNTHISNSFQYGIK